MSQPTNMLIKQSVVNELHRNKLTLQQCIDQTAELVNQYLDHTLTVSDAEKLMDLYNETWKEDMKAQGEPTMGFFPVDSFKTIQRRAGGMTPSQAAVMGMRWIMGSCHTVGHCATM